MAYTNQSYIFSFLWFLLSGRNNRLAKQPSTCNFELLKQKCDKATFKPDFVWDRSSSLTFNYYAQSILVISSYIISFFGIFTNSLLVYLILSKKFQEIFKGLNQYPYLCAMSIFNILILIIHLISWLSECEDSYDVFCHKTSRLVFFQFYKIIFKETLSVAFRFMGNFAYMGFAFNRVALIGKNHAKLVIFMSEMKFKKYMSFTIFLSLVFSVVKVFRFKVCFLLQIKKYNFFFL